VTARILGIDVGGTKVAAGIVDVRTGTVSERQRIATAPERGAAAVLADCLALARSYGPQAIGLGVCELVDREGRTRSAASMDWRDLDLAVELGVVAPCIVESDVRAAARAEARFGAGAGAASFLYVTISTGISHALVLGGEPWAGAGGKAIITGSPLVEDLAGGKALAERAGCSRAEDVLADPRHDALVRDAADMVGHELARLVNALDPGLVVIGGGLGLNERYAALVAASLERHVWGGSEAGLRVEPAALGEDAGLIGAALTSPGGAARARSGSGSVH
jgi:glucokinase